MSAEQVQAVLDRAIAEEAFRDLLARDAPAALASYDLTPEERARFGSGTASVEALEPRVSRTDLSAGFAVKTGAIDVRPPSETLKG